MQIINRTNNFKMIVTRLFVNKIDWLCKVKTIGDHNPGMLILDFDHDRIITYKRINLFIIYNYSYIQDTEQYLFLPAYDDII